MKYAQTILGPFSYETMALIHDLKALVEALVHHFERAYVIHFKAISILSCRRRNTAVNKKLKKLKFDNLIDVTDSFA